MTLVEAILSMLVATQPFYLDRETVDERTERMKVIATSIVQATEESTCTGEFKQEGCKVKFRGKPEELIVGLFTVAKFETHFAKHVHEDKCRKWECDAGRAKGLFQIHVSKTVPAELWSKIGGESEESTLLSARAAAAMWSRAWQCGSLEKAFSGYITSYCRANDEGKRRAKDYRLNLEVFRRLMRK